MEIKADLFSEVELKYNSKNGESQVIGILNPSAKKGFTTIKLPNGYNLSIQNDDIISCDIISTPKSQSQEKIATTPKSELPNVTIIHTGGTIASKVDYKTGAVTAKFEPEDLIDANPRLSDVANISAKKIGNMFYDDIRPQHWN